MKPTFLTNRNFWKLVLVGTIMLMMNACSSSHLHYSGTYKITSIEGNVVTFKGVNGKYSIPKEGLTIGQKIPLKRTYQKEKTNVYLVR